MFESGPDVSNPTTPKKQIFDVNAPICPSISSLSHRAGPADVAKDPHICVVPRRQS